MRRLSFHDKRGSLLKGSMVVIDRSFGVAWFKALTPFGYAFVEERKVDLDTTNDT